MKLWSQGDYHLMKHRREKAEAENDTWAKIADDLRNKFIEADLGKIRAERENVDRKLIMDGFREQTEELEKEIDQYRTALEKIRNFIGTLPMTVFGEGSNSDGMTWPIRDEFIYDITLTLDREAMKGSFRERMRRPKREITGSEELRVK